MNKTGLGTIEIILGQVPAKANKYKIGKGKMYRDSKVDNYERTFNLQCIKYKNAGIEDEFEFTMTVYFKTRASDLDNAVKTVLDCLQKCGAIKNDNKCMALHLYKEIDKKNPRIEFKISTLKAS